MTSDTRPLLTPSGLTMMKLRSLAAEDAANARDGAATAEANTKNAVLDDAGFVALLDNVENVDLPEAHAAPVCLLRVDQ